MTRQKFSLILFLLTAACVFAVYQSGLITNILSPSEWLNAVKIVLDSPSYIITVPSFSVPLLGAFILPLLAIFLILTAPSTQSNILYIPTPKKSISPSPAGNYNPAPRFSAPSSPPLSQSPKNTININLKPRLHIEEKTLPTVSEASRQSKKDAFKNVINFVQKIKMRSMFNARQKNTPAIAPLPKPEQNQIQQAETKPFLPKISLPNLNIGNSVGSVFSGVSGILGRLTIKKPKPIIHEINPQEIVEEKDITIRVMEWYASWSIVRAPRPRALIADAIKLSSLIDPAIEEKIEEDYGMRGGNALTTIRAAASAGFSATSSPSRPPVSEYIEEEIADMSSGESVLKEARPDIIEDDISASLNKNNQSEILDVPLSPSLDRLQQELNDQGLKGSTEISLDELTPFAGTSGEIDLDNPPPSSSSTTDSVLASNDVIEDKEKDEEKWPVNHSSQISLPPPSPHILSETARTKMREIMAQYRTFAKESGYGRHFAGKLSISADDPKTGESIPFMIDGAIASLSSAAKIESKGREGALLFIFIELPAGHWQLEEKHSTESRDQWIFTSETAEISLGDSILELFDIYVKERGMRGAYASFHVILEDGAEIHLPDQIPHKFEVRTNIITANEWLTMMEKFIKARTIFDDE